MTHLICPYILECDFPIPKQLTTKLPQIHAIYKEYWELENRVGNDMPIQDEEITFHLTRQISQIVEEEFIVDRNYILDTPGLIGSMRLYLQTNEHFVSVFHNHVHTPGNISSVFYLNVPKEGGEIEFTNSKLKENIKIKPKEGKIYFFPKWLDHKPLPQEDKEPRFCFNWDYPGNIRPVIRKNKILW